MVFADVRAVLAFAFVAYAWSHDFAQAVNVVATEAEAILFSGPIVTFTIASSTSCIFISVLFLLAAKSEASFITFSRSAPENPAVFFAIVFKSISSDIFFFLE